MIKAIIFDINGVLITDKTPSLHQVSRIRDEHMDFDKDLGSLIDGKMSARSFWSKFIGATREKIRPLKETMILLEELKKKYKLYTLSNATADSTAEKLERYGLSKYFDHNFTSYEIGHPKPALEIFRHVLASTNLNADECLFLDDMKENTASARILGFETLTVKDPVEIKGELEFLGIL